MSASKLAKVTDTYDVFVPRHEVEAAVRKAREKAGERRRLNNKVDQWKR